MNDLGLKDKVVVVTGGGGALGGAFARGFADQGAALAILDVSLDKAKAAATSFPAEKVKAIAVAADVSKDEQVAAAIGDVVKRLGTVDILVNAAGVQIYPPKSIVDLEPGEWDLVVDICLKGMYICARHVVPILKAKGGGKIVNIASIAGHRGAPGGSAYSAAKGGVVNLTRQMAVELAQFKINVNSVSPGFTPTPAHDDLRISGRRTRREGLRRRRVGKQFHRGPARQQGRARRLRWPGSVSVFSMGQFHHRRRPARRGWTHGCEII